MGGRGCGVGCGGDGVIFNRNIYLRSSFGVFLGYIFVFFGKKCQIISKIRQGRGQPKFGKTKTNHHFVGGGFLSLFMG